MPKNSRRERKKRQAKRGGGSSMLVPKEREEYVSGGLIKTITKLFKKDADNMAKKVSEEVDTVFAEAQRLQTEGLKGTELNRQTVENLYGSILDKGGYSPITPDDVGDIVKSKSFKKGGGSGGLDPNAPIIKKFIHEARQTYRAVTTTPTVGQRMKTDMFGGMPVDRASRQKAAKFFGVGLETGLPVGIAIGVGGSALFSSWFTQNDDAPATKKEASSFEKAFSEAWKNDQDTFEFQDKTYTTELKRDGEEMREDFQEGGMPTELPVDIPQETPMAMPPEMVEDTPVDTYTPEDQANAEETQVPDEQMEDTYIEFILNESLDSEEQEYLMNTLEGDPQLSQIFDKVVDTASEFSGTGEVEGPGDGVSDSIPARLSDGEFVMSQKATEELGADQLQTMMDDAERAYDGGMMRKKRYLGGTMGDEEELGLMEEEKSTDDDIRKLMSIKANKTPSLR